ncbi:MAG: hypothetical protein IPL46_04850 [Saprospiraceae bacterium]|nr:hypothetical protein [Saprospiraceae bacterium]
MEVFLMQDKTPWEIISAAASLPLTNQRQEYELLIANPTTETLSTIQFQFGDENTTYWMDNIQMFDANITPTNPSEYLIFEFNATITEKSVSLDGQYLDAHGTLYDGNVMIPPYHSVVLIKKECLGTGAILCPQSDCDYSSNPIQPNTYFASNQVSSSGIVQQNATIEFLAGNLIQLNPGFTVQSGGAFEAKINNCMIQSPSSAMHQ